MKTNNLWRYSLFILILYSCNGTNKNENKNHYDYDYTINISKSNKEINKYNQLIDIVKYVRLETTPKSIFGEITKMEIYKDTIIIFDKMDQLLLTFNINGQFIKKIGINGHCPWCYSKISDFTINHRSGNVLIFDAAQQKIIYYSLKGNYIHLQRTALIFPSNFALLDKDVVYFNDYSPLYKDKDIYYNILVTKNDKLIHKYFHFNKGYKNWYAWDRVFYFYKGSLNYINYWAGKIFSISKNGVIGRFNLNFGNKTLPLNIVKTDNLFSKNNKKYVYLYDNVVENNEYLTFLYMYKGKIKQGIFSKRDNRFYRVNAKEFKLFLFQPIYSYKNTFISAIDSRAFVNNISTEKDSEILNLSNHIKVSDNPILVFHYTKKKIDY